MEQNDIYYVIFPDSLLHDFSFFQIILFLKMLYFSVFSQLVLFFLQVLQEDSVRIMTGLHQFASKLLFLSPFWAKQSNLNTKKYFHLLCPFGKHISLNALNQFKRK